jgi:structure-specific recognition protein 1
MKSVLSLISKTPIRISQFNYRRDDILCEIRLYIPTRQSENREAEEGEDNNIHEASKIKEEILKLANIGSIGDEIAIIPELPLITPRGKFDLHILKDYLKIHGQTHDYKIPFKGITRIFLLPHVDKIHIAFVLGIEPPIRQGNTSYPFLVFQLKKELVITVNLNLPKDSEERKKILVSPLEGESLTGNAYDVIAKLFKAIIGTNIIIPGNFRSSKNNPSIKCSLKANEGFLYPLERGMIFIHKPVVYIKLEDVSYVECVRVTESVQKSFDLHVHTNKNNEKFQFSGILREEYDSIIKYLALKKIKVKSIEEGTHKIVEVNVSNTKTITSRRQKHLLENNNLELPSDESEFDDNYNSEEEMDVDEESEDSGKKKKAKSKKDRKKD